MTYKELITAWALERSEKFQLLPSDASREWIELFAEWLDTHPPKQEEPLQLSFSQAANLDNT